jgi:glycosyltransferase involved in cell wall biosynthesis
MRITFVLPCYPWKPIGGFRVVYEYANQLVARGHEVAVIHPRRLSKMSPPPAGSLYQRLRRMGGKLRDLVLTPSVHWQPLDKRVRMLYVPEPTSRNVPDGHAVFATAWQTVEYVADSPPSKGKKFYLVMDFAPLLGPLDRLEATWRQPFQKVTISRWLYEQVCGAEGGAQNTVNISIGIGHQRFRLATEIGRRPKRVAMFFGFASYKAPRDGIAALEIARRRHPDMDAVVFGQSNRKPKDVPFWASYQANVSEEKLIAIYNSSSIFVCSSVAEGFALPPAEAMACGCAVAATDCGGIREYAEHEVTALLSAPHDPGALARNIVRLLDDDNLRQKLAKAGHRRIQGFTWERSTDQLERFILERVSARAGG